LIDCETATVLETSGVDAPPIWSIAYAPSGEYVAVGTGFGEVQFRRATNAGLIGALRGHRERVMSMAFASEGERLATSGDDGTVRLWDVRDALRGSGSTVQPAALNAVLSPDGSLVMVARADGSVSAHEADSGAVRWSTVASASSRGSVVAVVGDAGAMGGQRGRRDRHH
jgi:WD40 repeat protein